MPSAAIMWAVGDGLDVQSIVDDAIARTGIDDIGDDWFLGPLAAWADDLRSDNLTDSGGAFPGAAPTA